MIDFLDGKIAIINPEYVSILVNEIGFKVFTPNPYVFKEDENIRIYVYNHVREDEYSLYGFKTIEERDMFDLGLSGKEDSSKKREYISSYYRLGKVNAKTLLKRLNMIDISVEELKEVMSKYEDS